MAADEIAFKFEEVELKYGAQTVFEGLNLSVIRGEVFGILGRIGSGKTRILRLLANLEKPSSGRIAFCEALSGQPFSYIFQNDLLVPWLTVEENLKIAVRDPSQRLHALSESVICRRLGIEAYLNKRPFQLSGGMRKKVNFARGFLNKDPLMLMDEPFGALDPAQKREMQQVFFAARASLNATVVLVTHDIREALLICDRIALLSSRSHRLVEVMGNPFVGRTDVDALFIEPEYRRLFQVAQDFYERESFSS